MSHEVAAIPELDSAALGEELSAQIGQGANLAISYVVHSDDRAEIIVHDRDANGEDVSDIIAVEDVEAVISGHGKKSARSTASRRSAKSTWKTKEQREKERPDIAQLIQRITVLEQQVAALAPKTPPTPPTPPKP